MKVLITGGAGFIGSHLADRLIAKGEQVVVIDNFSTGRRENLNESPALTVVEGSIADTELVHKVFLEHTPDVVVHAAASYKDPDNWVEDSLTNVLGSVNTVQASVKAGVKRIVYFQTSLCYGLNPLEQPITIEHQLFAHNTGGSSYAISKTAAELYMDLSGLDYVSFRLANAYGPRNLSGPLPTFYQRLTTGKPCFVMDTRRDFIFIDDMIEIVMKAVGGMGLRGSYHISSGSDFSIKELFDATIAELGITLEKDVEVRPRSQDDTYTILLDPSKTEREFDWRVSTPLKEGVAKAVKWYAANEIQQTYTHLKKADE